ncbi:hypothetical protein DL764_006701 [Monosporascus ibericus]|uniref:SWIM-type domain-containing protein n=1 Tax=Monosporascus ibericus TaxID=155417 RepID=A0A4Q4T7I9_9PEZI|nr:hypothetical protein DL764_006701 [Monosporascus ibericus]
MVPTTRSQSRSQQEDPSSDSEGESVYDYTPIVAPSKLAYSLSNLDEDSRDSVIDTFSEPPRLSLKAYASREQYAVFEVEGLATYEIRTGAEDSHFAFPTCTCGAQEKPCGHIIWLFDQLASQSLTNKGQTLTMTNQGYAAQLGRPFAKLTDFHIDMFVDSLHYSPADNPSPRRVQETREILASLNDTPVDEYRPDLVGGPGEEGEIINRGDLEKTVFSMLLRNNDFFLYFLSLMPSDEVINNRFRRLEQRASAAFEGLDAYAANPALWAARSPKNVAWCAAHLALVLDQVSAAIQTAAAPPEPWEQRAAARTVMRVLEGVVERAGDVGPAEPLLPRGQRNLFFCLIGDEDRGFAVGVLDQLPPAVLAPWLDRLAAVEARVLSRGVPPSYLENLRSLIARVRGSASSSPSSFAAAGAKRSGHGNDRRAKRMK